MTIVRIVFLALAVLLPTTWTIAQAADEPPAGGDTKSESGSSSKSKKSNKKSGKKSESGDKSKSDKSDAEPAK